MTSAWHASEQRPTVNRGESVWWVALAMSMAGTLFPHVFARDFLDDHRIVRWISIPILIASAIVLIDHNIVRLVRI